MNGLKSAESVWWALFCTALSMFALIAIQDRNWVEQSAFCVFMCVKLNQDQMHSLSGNLSLFYDGFYYMYKECAHAKNSIPVHYLLKIVSTIIFADVPAVILQSK